MTNCRKINHKTDKLTCFNELVNNLMEIGQNLKNNRYGKQV